MELVWIIYAIGILPGEGKGAALIIPVMVTALFFFLAMDSSLKESTRITFRSFSKIGFTACCLATVIFTILPTSKTAYKMLAAYGVTEVAMSDTVSKLAPKSLEYLELTLDKELGKLRANVKD